MFSSNFKLCALSCAACCFYLVTDGTESFSPPVHIRSQQAFEKGHIGNKYFRLCRRCGLFCYDPAVVSSRRKAALDTI